MKKINYILFLLLFVFKLSAQDDLIVSHSRFMQKSNPSFMGINNMNKNQKIVKTVYQISINPILLSKGVL